MDLKIMMPSERIHTQKSTYYTIHLYEVLEQAKLRYGERNQNRGCL